MFIHPLRAATVRYNAAASKASESRTTRTEATATTLMSMKGAKALGCAVVMKHVLQNVTEKETTAYGDARKQAVPLHIIRK